MNKRNSELLLARVKDLLIQHYINAFPNQPRPLSVNAIADLLEVPLDEVVVLTDSFRNFAEPVIMGRPLQIHNPETGRTSHITERITGWEANKATLVAALITNDEEHHHETQHDEPAPR